MYVLTHNDQVLLGPIGWNSRMFNSVIEEDTEIVTNILPSDFKNVPLDLESGLKIRETKETRDVINPKIEMHNGPFWTFDAAFGTANFIKVDKPLDLIKSELKALLASERYRREQLGTKVTIQNIEVTIDTARGSRDVFVQQYLLMPVDGTTTWKFPEGWLTLTKADLGACVSAGVTHVQAQFGWEAAIVVQIESAIDAATLDALEIVEPTAVPGEL